MGKLQYDEADMEVIWFESDDVMDGFTDSKDNKDVDPVEGETFDGEDVWSVP